MSAAHRAMTSASQTDVRPFRPLTMLGASDAEAGVDGDVMPDMLALVDASVNRKRKCRAKNELRC